MTARPAKAHTELKSACNTQKASINQLHKSLDVIYAPTHTGEAATARPAVALREGLSFRSCEAAPLKRHGKHTRRKF